MILDSKEQQDNLLAIIREVPIQGRMEEAIQIINMLKGLEGAVQSAELVTGSQELKIANDE